VVVVADLMVVVGGSGGARAAGWWARCLGFVSFFLFYEISVAESNIPLSAHV
jgi:hypothetical protein